MRQSFIRRNDRRRSPTNSRDGKFLSPSPVTCYFPGMASKLNRTDCDLAESSLQNSSASFSSIVCDSSSTESEDDDYFMSSKTQNQIHRGKKRKFRNDDDGKMILEDLNMMPEICEVDHHVPAIWFQLVASKNKNYRGNLPSLPPYYIRIKDVNMRVSTIKKYLVAKLGLKSANELQINMQGEPVHPDTELWRLMKIWVETEKRSAETPCAAAGSSGQELVMILSYSWSSEIDPF